MTEQEAGLHGARFSGGRQARRRPSPGLVQGRARSHSAAAADQRTYTAGRFSLDIDGVNCGWMVGLDGGERGSRRRPRPPGGERQHPAQAHRRGQVRRSHASGRQRDEQADVPVDQGLVRQGIERREERCDQHRRLQLQREAPHHDEPSVHFVGNDPGARPHVKSGRIYIAVHSLPGGWPTSRRPGSPCQGAKQKAWLPANFVFELDGVDTSRVASIDSFTWKCAVAADGSQVLDVSDIGVSFPARPSLSSWQRVVRRDMASGADDERDGALTTHRS